MSNLIRDYVLAGDALARRLNILKKLRHQHEVDLRATSVELGLAEIFEPDDDRALQAWEAMRHRLLGEVPLPFDGGN